MIRKLLIALFSFILTVAAVFVSVACSNQNLIINVNENINVEYMSYFEIPTVCVMNKDGLIGLQPTVKTNDGKTKTVSNGMFLVDDFGGYTLEYAYGGASATTKITVVDTTAPQIINENSAYDKISVSNGSYTIPVDKIRAYDNGDLTDVSFKAYYGNNELKITDNTFPVEKAGVYTVEISATDANNNTSTKELTISATEFNTDNLLFDFETDYDFSLTEQYEDMYYGGHWRKYSYAENKIKALVNGGESCAVLLSSWVQYSHGILNFDREIKAGTTITMWWYAYLDDIYYQKAIESGAYPRLQVDTNDPNSKATVGSSDFKYKEWFPVTITTVTDCSKIQFFWNMTDVSVEGIYEGIGNTEFYLDNVMISYSSSLPFTRQILLTFEETATYTYNESRVSNLIQKYSFTDANGNVHKGKDMSYKMFLNGNLIANSNVNLSSTDVLTVYFFDSLGNFVGEFLRVFRYVPLESLIDFESNTSVKRVRPVVGILNNQISAITVDENTYIEFTVGAVNPQITFTFEPFTNGDTLKFKFSFVTDNLTASQKESVKKTDPKFYGMITRTTDSAAASIFFNGGVGSYDVGDGAFQSFTYFSDKDDVAALYDSWSTAEIKIGNAGGYTGTFNKVVINFDHNADWSDYYGKIKIRIDDIEIINA